MEALSDLQKGGVSAFLTGGGSASLGSVAIDFGTNAVAYKEFVVVDPLVSPTTVIMAVVGHRSDLGREADEIAVDPITITAVPGTGEFTLKAMAQNGRVSGKYGVIYLLG